MVEPNYIRSELEGEDSCLNFLSSSCRKHLVRTTQGIKVDFSPRFHVAVYHSGVIL